MKLLALHVTISYWYLSRNERNSRFQVTEKAAACSSSTALDPQKHESAVFPWLCQYHVQILTYYYSFSDNLKYDLLNQQELTIISPVRQTKKETGKCGKQENEHKYKCWSDATNDPCQQQYGPQTLDTIHIQPAL